MLRTLVGVIGAVVLSWVATAPAFADSAIQVSQVENLDPQGTEVTITGTGYQPNVGLFVVLCDPAIANGGSCDMANFKQVTTSADGTFEQKLTVMAKFGQTSCMKTPCAIQTSKVGDGADRTQEYTVPVSFKGGVAATPSTASASASPNPESANTADASDDSGSSSTMTLVLIAAVVVVVAGAGLLILRRRTTS